MNVRVTVQIGTHRLGKALNKEIDIFFVISQIIRNTRRSVSSIWRNMTRTFIKLHLRILVLFNSCSYDSNRGLTILFDCHFAFFFVVLFTIVVVAGVAGVVVIVEIAWISFSNKHKKQLT